jgi:hypothetical protein
MKPTFRTHKKIDKLVGGCSGTFLFWGPEVEKNEGWIVGSWGRKIRYCQASVERHSREAAGLNPWSNKSPFM